MDLKSAFTKENLSKFMTRGVGTPFLILIGLSLIMLPIPAWLLDISFTFNITLSMLVLLVTIYSKRPLDFAAFPTVLLVATLLRLALNIASTRVVLMHGSEGAEAAGKVIHAFGDVLIGNNYLIGFVVFAILIIINFVVITKGAGRISEVTARFTLDAMPGKQMAIDADLNAGLITQDVAKARRKDVAAEAEFYGSMDGTSKFVKGDAIAGILIMVINLVFGLIIGVSNGMTVSDAAGRYSKLTIGDGLVAQIPSLLLSISSAIIVTRQNESNDMGKLVLGQMFSVPKPLIISGAILFLMGIVPGMPHVPFLLLAFACLGGAYLLVKREKELAAAKARAPAEPAGESNAMKQKQKELSWDDVTPIDVVGLEIGYRLIPLVDKAKGGELLSRVKGVRKKMSQDLGFLIPPVHIRDNLDLSPNRYRITIEGVSFGEADVFTDRKMAINPGQVFGEVQGTKTVDPAFGLEAVWISADQENRAQGYGYTVVDAPTVIATHLSQILSNNADVLLGHEEVQNLLNIVGKSSPKLVEGLVPGIISLGNLAKVLQNLLSEGVPIRDMRTIIQTIVEYAPRSQDPEVLTAACRIALRRFIIQDIVGGGDVIPVITLAPELERILHKSLQSGGQAGAAIEPGLAQRMQKSLAEAAEKQELDGEPAILLTSGVLRTTLSRFVKNSIPGLRVLSYQEIPEEKQIKIVSSVGQQRQTGMIK